jgi:hypothetical protein
MLEIRLKPICHYCKDININVETKKLYSCNEAVEAHHTITCTHENVCKKLTNSQSEEAKG